MQEDKKKATVKVVATPFFMATRYISLPPELVTPEEFKALKSGEAVEIDKKKLNGFYFEEVKDGNS
jgi:hypothetical protein